MFRRMSQEPRFYSHPRLLFSVQSDNDVVAVHKHYADPPILGEWSAAETIVDQWS